MTKGHQVFLILIVYLIFLCVENSESWFTRGPYRWPIGTYGLPMPTTGCPNNTDFAWEIGERSQKTDLGSTRSNSTHLAGVDTSSAKVIVQKFCMKIENKKEGSLFDRGSYCIFKKNNCPKGFWKGWIYWDDAAWAWSRSQYKSGHLPDGEFNINTKIYFCCRMDAKPSKPISLPTQQPFFLLKIGSACQKVRGMEVQEEWVCWSDNDGFKSADHRGMHPDITPCENPYTGLNISYCYYKKGSPNLTLIIIIIVGCSCSGGVILLYVTIKAAKRCSCLSKRRRQFNVWERTNRDTDEETTTGMVQPETEDNTSLSRNISICIEDRENRLNSSLSVAPLDAACIPSSPYEDDVFGPEIVSVNARTVSSPINFRLPSYEEAVQQGATPPPVSVSSVRGLKI